MPSTPEYHISIDQTGSKRTRFRPTDDRRKIAMRRGHVSTPLLWPDARPCRVPRRKSRQRSPAARASRRGNGGEPCTFPWGSIGRPNPTRLLTQRGLLNRERESLGTGAEKERFRRRSPHKNRELSRRWPSSQVVATLAEKTKRRERLLSALCVNWIVGWNSAI